MGGNVLLRFAPKLKVVNPREKKIAKKKDPRNFPISKMIFAKRKWKIEISRNSEEK